MKQVSQSLIKLLQTVDTPTVCNAIEVSQGQRGFADYTKKTVMISTDKKVALVGYATTAKISGTKPSSDTPEQIKARRMDYYQQIFEAPKPSIVVIEDTDYPQCVAAFWGEVNASIHRGFGCSGTLTNGVMRDLFDLGDYPVIAGSVGPSHAFVRVDTLAEKVNVFGLEVSPGDLIHVDRHGAVVIPESVYDSLESSLHSLIENEKIVINPSKDKDYDFEKFKQSWEEFERVRT